MTPLMTPAAVDGSFTGTHQSFSSLCEVMRELLVIPPQYTPINDACFSSNKFDGTYSMVSSTM